MAEITEVRDKPTEIWIKLLFFITAIAVGLLGYIGKRVIDGQDNMAAEIGKININLQVYGSRISRIEYDVKEIRSATSNNSNRLYKLEGAK